METGKNTFSYIDASHARVSLPDKQAYKWDLIIGVISCGAHSLLERIGLR
jgi:hypothetical protein